MEVRVFTLEERYREDLEELMFQLSEKKRKIHLDTHSNVYSVGAFDGERLVGFAQLFILPKTTFTIGHLEDLIVHYDYRRGGLGRKIMDVIISLARREECSVINLTVRPEREAAEALYRSIGFEEIKTNVLRLRLV